MTFDNDLTPEESSAFIEEVREYFKGDSIPVFAVDESGNMVAWEEDAVTALDGYLGEGT